MRDPQRLTFLERSLHRLANRASLARRHLHLPRGVMSVSFDDFPKLAWEVGGAVLAGHGARGTYYASGGLCGQIHDGLRQYDADDLEAAHDAGHEIGCHTFEHLSAAQCAGSRFLDSIARNRAFLATRLPGARIESFAFPYGHSAPLLQWRVASRFSSCRGVRAGLNGPVVEASLLRAVALAVRQRHEYDIPALIEAAAAERRWLILYTHDVQERPSDWGCTPAELDAALRRARAAGLEIAPVGEVMRKTVPASGSASPGAARPGGAATA